MQTKNILVGLLSLTAIAEATAIHRPFDNLMNRRAARSIETRQNFGNRFGNGGFGRGGQNGGQNNGQNGGQNNGQNQGNQGNNNNNNQGQNGGNQDQTQDQNQGNNGNNNNNGNQAALTLNADALQTGSAQDGDPDTANGEAASKTDDANFINFCSGKELTNGLQKTGGSCNGIVMGQIPAKSNMVSSVLVNPQNGDDIAANQDFQIQVQVANFAPGTFTNADNTYYTAPQDLDGSGNIIGHTHVTVQDLGGSLNPTTPLDASQFAFFKGINDAGQGGLLSADVAGGLPAGNYRLCTMFAAANHQPVIMPVAQRGAQDDCVRFTVGANNNNNGGNNNNNNNGGNNNNNGGNNNNGQNGQNGQNGGNGQNQGNQGQNSNDSTGDQNGNNQADNSQNSALGGIAAPAVTNSGDSSRPFSVNGNTFANEAAAIQRSCDIQQNACSDAANSGKTGLSVNDCQAQQQQCLSAAGQ